MPVLRGERVGDISRFRGSWAAYTVATAITVAAVLGQYATDIVPGLWILYSNAFVGLFTVYGLPILTFAVLVGSSPIRNWNRANGPATVEGLRWFGLASLAALASILVITVVFELFDPAALEALSRPNPQLTRAATNPWFWIGFSFVVGAIEELIFRGWIFGYPLLRSPSRWLLHATWTSALFAGVHLYYGTTYGLASLLIAPDLFFLGIAFAFTVRYSKGNLLVVALLHGAVDATAFGTLINENGALALRYGLVALGLLVALVVFLRERRKRPAPPSSTFPLPAWSPTPAMGAPLLPPPPPDDRLHPSGGPLGPRPP